jgi:tripartite-type tricarboxylate transporter receptor subunit TctC
MPTGGHATLEIVDKLNTEINAVLADPNIIARIAEQSASPFPTSRVDQDNQDGE